MTKSHKRTAIPADVRQRLWINAAGRCEFKGCGKPVGTDFLTGRKINVGELAHIVSDSPDGPRGDAGRSKELAKDEANLMLACFDCHKRIDALQTIEDYPEALLLKWKLEHESRVSAIYGAEVGTVSLPVVMALPIGKHTPHIVKEHVTAAILKNSDYTVHPRNEHVVLNRPDLDVRDDDPDYWRTAERALSKWYQQVLEPKFSGTSPVEHLSIAAFAPIPLVMKLGALIGDKRPAHVLDLPNNKWLWRDDEAAKETADDWFDYEVPASLPRRIFVGINVSNHARDFEQIVGDTPIVHFSAKSPRRELIGSQINLDGFKRRFNDFLIRINRSGAQELDLLPVTSLSAGLEVGRGLLQKTFNRVTVWDYQDGDWVRALNLVG